MLLAIDSATRKIGIALYDGVEVIHEAVWFSKNRHTVELSPAIEVALDRAGYQVEDIKVIGLAIGPGSYTGLRIGAAVAKGFALARHIPLVGISTFDILAIAQVIDKEMQLAVVLEAGRKRISVAYYEANEDVWVQSTEPDIYTVEEFTEDIQKPSLVCGELSEDAKNTIGKNKNVKLISPAQGLRRPAYLAELAWARWEAGDVEDPATLFPKYLQTGDNIPA